MGDFVSICKVLLSLSGDFELLEQVRQAQEELAYTFQRIKRKPGPDAELRNFLLIKLIQWERRYDPRDKKKNLTDEEAFSSVTIHLQQILPLLASFDRSRYRVELRIQITCGLGNEGLLLPVEFLTVTSSAGMPLGISILVLSEEDGTGDEPEQISGTPDLGVG
jgi:hypothetical protein